MENKKDIGKAFREKLDGLQKQPGNAVWDALKKDLPKKKPGFLPLFWIEASNTIKTIVVTLLTGLIVVSGYFLIKDKDYKNDFKTKGDPFENNGVDTAGNSVNTANSNYPNTTAKPDDGNNVVGNDLTNNSGTTLGNKNKNLPENKLGNDGNGANSSASNKNNNIPNLSSTNAFSGTNKKRSGSSGGSTTATSPNSRSSKSGRIYKYKTGTTNNDNSIAGRDGKNSHSSTNKNAQPANNSSRFSNNMESNRSSDKGDSEVASTNNDGSKTKTGSDNSVSSGGNTVSKTTSSNGNTVNFTTSENALKLTDTISQIADSLCNIAIANTTVVCKDTVEENTIKNNKAGIADLKRFYIFAYTSPTSFTLSNVLAPDSLLVSNATTTKVSYNYGAYIGYNFNKKWSLRTGIGVAGLQQTIKNAFLQNTYAVVPGSENDPNGYVHLFAPANYAAINYTRNGSNAAVVQNLGSQQGQATVNIIQKIEFAEVPLEVNYNVFGDKFGAGVMGGLSTIFTTKNIVYAQNNKGTLWLGTNKNVKDVGFSATIGLHFYYRPLPYLQINAEPVFKYYLNTFNNSQPYSFGLQAGLQFNFDLFAPKK